MYKIHPSVNNAFFFWAGDPAGKIAQINTAIHNFHRHNPDKTLYLFSNDLSLEILHKEVVRTCPLTIVKWTPKLLVQDTPFEDRAHELDPDFIMGRHAGDSQVWIVFSDFFRYLVLWRWGGTYMDLDDVSIRPLPNAMNLVPSSIPQASMREEGFGVLARDRSARAERYLRLGSDPLIRFQPNHSFLRCCFELALIRPPGISGSRVMTEVYETSTQTPEINARPCIDVILHPGHGLAEYVSRQYDWPEKWWWSGIREHEFRDRWSSLLRLGTFSSIKNHGWKPLDNLGSTRTLSEWVCGEAMRAIGNTVGTSGDGGISVSVVVPTHRQRFLSDTLDALAAQNDKDFEVLVVENGENQSTTEALVGRYVNAFDVHYVFEKRLGLNVARNTGCRLATGSIIAFLDDDCVPALDWIASIKSRYRSSPRDVIVSGKVSLRFRARSQGWIQGDFRSLLSELALNENEENGATAPWVVGANFSIRKEVFWASGGFDEAFGMIGRSSPQLCNDETEFCRRVQSLTGTAVVFDSRIAVEHQVPAERLEIEYFEQRKFGQGISDACLIIDRERRPVTDALEKLEAYLYDPGWFDALSSKTSRMRAEDRRIFLLNSIRTRIEYISGLAEVCLAKFNEKDQIHTVIGKYEGGGRLTVKRWLRQNIEPEKGLIRLAKMTIRSAVKKPKRHQWHVKPSILLGRTAFFRTMKLELAALQSQTPLSTASVCRRPPHV